MDCTDLITLFILVILTMQSEAMKAWVIDCDQLDIHNRAVLIHFNLENRPLGRVVIARRQFTMSRNRQVPVTPQ
jgi:hypothetical protein